MDLLRILPLPVASANRSGPPVALLLARDRQVGKWGLRWLEQVGFEVIQAGSLEEGLALTPREGPGAVLLEERAFAGERSTLLAGLRETWAAVPLVVLTSSEEGLEWALGAGAADVVELPCDWRVVSRRAMLLTAVYRSAGELQKMSRLLEEARSAAEESRRQLAQLTGTDPLTELPNRQRFEEMLGKALRAGAPDGGRIAVLLLDLDRFRALNEAAGRRVGDEVLRQLATRLMKALRDGALVDRVAPGASTAAVGRLAEDELALLLSSVKERRQLEAVAQRTLELMAEPFSIDGNLYHLTASLGISVAPEDGLDPQLLVLRAESALGLARSHGGGVFRFYQAELDHSARSLELERALHGALRRGELSLVFQPLVTVRGQRIVGVEALLRWNHPELGEVPPDEFIPIAEESGLIVPIGNWAIHSACGHLRRWLDAGMEPLRLAVNLSAAQLAREDLPEVVAAALREHRIDPALLELEISERGSFRDDRELHRAFARLKELGVRLSVDDFGTGQSAIVYLRRFPVDVLKIDRSYISAMHCSESDAVMASAMVAMAQRLRLTVVAEGVELEEQREALERWGCDAFQGLLFSPGVGAGEVERLLSEQEVGP
jgi:diguanylate cyclase (GGDEF)-like protein